MGGEAWRKDRLLLRLCALVIVAGWLPFGPYDFAVNAAAAVTLIAAIFGVHKVGYDSGREDEAEFEVEIFTPPDDVSAPSLSSLRLVNQPP